MTGFRSSTARVCSSTDTDACEPRPNGRVRAGWDKHCTAVDHPSSRGMFCNPRRDDTLIPFQGVTYIPLRLHFSTSASVNIDSMTSINQSKRPSPIYIPDSTSMRLWRLSAEHIMTNDEYRNAHDLAIAPSFSYHRSPLKAGTMSTKVQDDPDRSSHPLPHATLSPSGLQAETHGSRWKKALRTLFARKKDVRESLEEVECRDWTDI